VRISGVRPQRTNAPSDASKPAKDLLYVGGPFGRQVVSPWREVKVLARRKGEKEKKREKRKEREKKRTGYETRRRQDVDGCHCKVRQKRALISPDLASLPKSGPSTTDFVGRDLKDFASECL